MLISLKQVVGPRFCHGLATKKVGKICACTSEFSVSLYILHSSSESKGNLDSKEKRAQGMEGEQHQIYIELHLYFYGLYIRNIFLQCFTVVNANHLRTLE